MPDTTPNHIGDDNIERLLSRAYEPVEPDGAFVEQVRARMVREGTRRADSRRPREWRWGWAALAAGVMLAVGVVAVVMKLTDRGGEQVQKPAGTQPSNVGQSLPTQPAVARSGSQHLPRA